MKEIKKEAVRNAEAKKSNRNMDIISQEREEISVNSAEEYTRETRKRERIARRYVRMP